MPTVHGVLLSPFVRKVRIALMEKGIDHEVQPLMPFPPHNQTPEFRKMSPLGKVPAYEEDGFAISDSSVIIAYLERKHPSPALYPEDARDYARALWFEELADSKMIEAVGPVFFNRIVGPNILGQPADEEKIAAGLEAIQPLFDYVESQIDGDYLAGESFSNADIGVGSVMRQHQIAQETVDASRWPKLAAYTERILARPSFASSTEAENAALGGG